MRASCLRAFAFAVPLVLSATASAHFELLEPKAADKSTDGGKGAPPCGPAADSGVVTEVTGGTEITVSVNETVTHPGFYRVALSLNSRTELPADNVVKDKDGKVLPPAGPGQSASADFLATPKFPVLADNLFPHTDGTKKMFSQKVLLPNVTCAKCTLQVLEFMAQHGPAYFYHHCADLKITADPAKPIFDPAAPAGGAGGTGGAASGGTGGAATGGAGGMGTDGSSAGSGSTTGGAAAGGAATAGAAAAGAGMAGTASAGAPTSAAGSGGSGATAPSTPADPVDDSGCSIGGRGRGAASLLAGLALASTLVQRRRRAQ